MPLKRTAGRPTKYADDTKGKTVLADSGNQQMHYEIVAKLYAPNGGLLLKEFRGSTAMEVYIGMTDWEYLIMPSHLIYLGTELQRAEYAIKEGKVEKFSQDPAPNKGL